MRRPIGLCKLIKNLGFLTATASCSKTHVEPIFRNGFSKDFNLDARIEIEFRPTVHKFVIFQCLKLIFSKNRTQTNLHYPLGRLI